MENLLDAGDRALEIAWELQAVVAETRHLLDVSRELVRRSRRQAHPAASRPDGPSALRADDPGPTPELVDGLIRAYELAEDDGDPRTRTLLGCTLSHVGCRIAAAVGPQAAGIVMQ